MIDIIYSGKNLYLPDLKLEHIKTMRLEQPVIQTQETGTETLFFNKKPIRLAYNNLVQMLMFFPYDTNQLQRGEEPDELERIELDSIDLFLDGKCTHYQSDQLIHAHFLGLDLCVLCFDEDLRDINKFKKYISNDNDLDMKKMKSINFSVVDRAEIFLNYNSDKEFHLFMTALNTNILRMAGGMAGLAYGY